MSNKIKEAIFFPSMLVLATVQKGRKESIITLTWNGYVSFEPLIVAVAIQPKRHSYKIVKKSCEFVLNIPRVDMISQVEICGTQSGRDINKWKACSFTKKKSKKISTPSIQECPVNIECQVQDNVVLGSHDLILARVVNIEKDKVWIKENRSYLVYTKGSYEVMIMK